MRQIKFRVWDDRNKVMLTEDNYEDLDFEELSEKWKKDDYMGYPYEGDEWYPMSSIQLFFELPEHEDLKIMQYTEFVDKNDNEIYEGDVLESENNSYFVLYRDAAFILKSLEDRTEDLMFQFAVHEMFAVGNLYENPELIKQDDVVNELPF